jgi:hypothetical protein
MAAIRFKEHRTPLLYNYRKLWRPLLMFRLCQSFQELIALLISSGMIYRCQHFEQLSVHLVTATVQPVIYWLIRISGA